MMDNEANTVWYEGYMILPPERVAHLNIYQAEAIYTGKQTVHGIGQTSQHSIEDAKRKIDALKGKGMGS